MTERALGVDHAIETRLDPGARDWPKHAEAQVQALVSDSTAAEVAVRFRQQLGLQDNATTGLSPIIMSGHQPQLWHPGILSKLFAARAVANMIQRDSGKRASVAWIVVDHDAINPGEIRVPVRESEQRLKTKTHRWSPLTASNLPACVRPAFKPSHLKLTANEHLEPAHLQDRLQTTFDVLAAHHDASNAAIQIKDATNDLLDQLFSTDAHSGCPDHTIMATDLASTDLFREIVEHATNDPRACAESYNAAARAYPKAAIRELEITGDIELPFWGIADDSARTHVTSANIESIQRLAPRAILMTALLRLAACDLFLHGTGGGEYEPVADHWISSWLGKAAGINAPATPPAPFGVASATLRLPFEGGPPPTDHDIARADWHAHHAKHSPAMLGDPESEQTTRTLAETIASHPRKSDERAHAFAKLHALLAKVRSEHATALEALQFEAISMRERAHDRDVMNDRTWSFCLHNPEDLRSLRNAIEHAIAGRTP